MMDQQHKPEETINEKENSIQRRHRHSRRNRKRSNKKLVGPLLLALVLIIVVIGSVVYHFTSTSNEDTQSEDNKVTTSTLSLKQEALDKPIYMLVVGKDKENPSQADALFLVALNKEQNSMDIIGIPANSKIDSRDKKSAKAINTIYSEGSMELTKAVVEDIFHINIPYYIIVDLNAFKHTINLWGPIDMYVEEDMSHVNANTSIQDISLKKGYQSLDEDNAFAYVRFADDGKDIFGRLQRQERFLKLMFANETRHLSLINAWKIWRIWNDFDSNISTFDAMGLAFTLNKLTPANVHYYILPGSNEDVDGNHLWSVNPTEAQRLIGITMGTISPDELDTPTETSLSTDSKSAEIEKNIKDKTGI